MLTKICLFPILITALFVQLQCNHHQQQCLEEIGIDLATIQNYHITNAEEPTEQLLCFMKCTFEKSGILKSDGSIDFVAFKMTHLGVDKNCVENLPPIQQCNDIVALQACSFNINQQ